MQFTCEACTTRYVIPDERVAGKLLRIRCKCCGAIVDVAGPGLGHPHDGRPPRGGADPFQEVCGSGPWRMTPTGDFVKPGKDFQVTAPSMVAATPPPLPRVSDGNAGWHVATQGKSRGPFTRQQLEDLAGEGGIHPRCWVWRPGTAAWQRLANTRELASVTARVEQRASQLCAGGLAQAPSVPPPAADSALPQRAGPFANLLANQALADAGAGLASGWYAATAEDVIRVLERAPLDAPGTSALVTGIHLLRDPKRRAMMLAAGLSASLLVLLGLLTLPLLSDLGHAAVHDVDRSPVQTVEVTIDARDPQWSAIRALAEPPPTPALPAP